MRTIVRITRWPELAIGPVVEESEREGFRFLRRAEDEWRTGANRFSGYGEGLYAVYAADRMLGLGGINRASAVGGRLRRFYVRPDARRSGVGRELLEYILGQARHHYATVGLRSDQPGADAFYRAHGFQRVEGGGEMTHEIALGPATPPLEMAGASLEVAASIIREAALRLESRGQTLWQPADLTVEALRPRVLPHEIFVGRIGGEPAVAGFLQDRDPRIWPGVEDSLILHKLAVRDRFVGQNVGGRFLDWAADLAARRQKRFLRLDTDATRPKMRAFYLRQGFDCVGTKIAGDFNYALFERPVHRIPDDPKRTFSP